MGRHGWIAHTVARMLDLLRFRAGRVVASVPDRLPKIGGVPRIGRLPLLARSGADDPIVPAASERSPDLPAEFPGAERFETPVAAGPVTEAPLADDVPGPLDDENDLARLGMAGEAATTSGGQGWSEDEMLTFTPDSSLDLVAEIEFSFEPEATLGDAEPNSDSDGRMVSVDDADALGWVEGDGSRECPEAFPIKGNGNSHIYHMPGQASYGATIPELCFATEDAAAAEGYRPVKRSQPAR